MYRVPACPPAFAIIILGRMAHHSLISWIQYNSTHLSVIPELARTHGNRSVGTRKNVSLQIDFRIA
jgi:hypothetical protein